jgi:hypothetical protein
MPNWKTLGTTGSADITRTSVVLGLHPDAAGAAAPFRCVRPRQKEWKKRPLRTICGGSARRTPAFPPLAPETARRESEAESRTCVLGGLRVLACRGLFPDSDHWSLRLSFRASGPRNVIKKDEQLPDQGEEECPITHRILFGVPRRARLRDHRRRTCPQGPGWRSLDKRSRRQCPATATLQLRCC